MRIGWYSNTPDSPTGYGVQTAQVVRRMVGDGHEVHVISNHGQIYRTRDWGGAHLWPVGRDPYSRDVLDFYVRMSGVEVLFTLYDVWVLKNTEVSVRTLSWTPIDHDPVTSEVLQWAGKHESIAMSEFGAEQLRRAGANVVATIPHTIEDVFRPTPSNVRERMGIPEDAFLVTIPAANIGATPPRKNWGGMLEAMARFMALHDDVRLYLHTDIMSPSGIPLDRPIKLYGLPVDRLKVPTPELYRGGFIGDDELANIYTTSDVILLATKGEGFGVPVIEAMGCGTPSIVSDFSAQPEIVGDTGWLVPGQWDYDHNQDSNFFTPYTIGIVRALEEAYAQRGQRRDACLQRAEQYRADKVYAEHWRPLLASLEAKPERIGNTKAAKRRKLRAVS